MHWHWKYGRRCSSGPSGGCRRESLDRQQPNPGEGRGGLPPGLGCTAGDNREVAAQCQYLFLGVKPQILPGVLEELAPILRCRATPWRAGLHGGRGLPGPAAKPGRGLPCGADHAQHACLRRGRYGALHPRRWGHSGAGGPASRRSGPRRSSWTGCQNPCWTPPAPWQAAALPLSASSWRPWPMAA